MARPRKPAKVLELSGAFRKNPARKRTRVAELAIKPGIGNPPADWARDAAHIGRCQSLLDLWNEIVAQDVLNVLNASHRLLVENTCHLMYKIRRASAGLGKATSGDYAQVKSNLAAMGMTPVDSPRVAEAVRVRDPGDARSSRAAAGGWGELVG
jgi:hypothetical protein